MSGASAGINGATVPEPVPAGFEIESEIRYSDALAAALSQLWRRARVALSVYVAAIAVLLLAAWLTAGALAWLAAVAALPGIAATVVVLWTTRVDFNRTGGKPMRMRFHVCESGLEITAASRSDWIAWDDLWWANETRRSFLVSPSPSEQYVIPKRCCDEGRAQALREMLSRALARGR